MNQAVPSQANANTTGGDSVRAASGSPPLAPRRPQSPPVERLTGTERRVMEQLHRHVGRANAITQARLAFLSGLSGKDPVRKLQIILKRLAEEEGIPIASACGLPAGTFLVDDPAEANEYIANLRSRAMSCFCRIKALNSSVARELAQALQAELPLPDTGEPEKNRARFADSPPGKCLWCGETFVRWRHDRLFCSTECRMHFHGRRTS